MPLSVKLSTDSEPKVTESLVPTACPMDIAGSQPSPALPDTETPVPPVTLST